MRSINRYDVAILASLALVFLASRGIGQQSPPLLEPPVPQTTPPQPVQQPTIILTQPLDGYKCKAATCEGSQIIRWPGAGNVNCFFVDDKVKRGWCYKGDVTDSCPQLMTKMTSNAPSVPEKHKCAGKFLDALDEPQDCDFAFHVCYTPQTPTPAGVSTAQ